MHWDFTKASHRQEARELAEREHPDWIIGAPHCGPFSRPIVNANLCRMDERDVQTMIATGRIHLGFACQLDAVQLRRGKFFLHEHPDTAESGKETAMLRVLKLPGVNAVVTDQCMFDNLTHTSDGTQGLARKPTRCVSNSKFMLAELVRKCDGGHEHNILEGGRAAPAAFYPLQLLLATLRGIARTIEATEATRTRQTYEYDASLSIAYATADLSEPPAPNTAQLPQTSIPFREGGGVQPAVQG